MDHDVPDATDWLKTPLSAFAVLENALHCQICKEFYDTPMVTSCSHTFCSKCIRTCLSTDGRCPTCRATDQASKLRNNWALQEVVGAFKDARKPALDVARKHQELLEQSTRPGKRKREVQEDNDGIEVDNGRRTTRSRSKRIAASQASQPDLIEVADSDEDGGFGSETREPDDGLVECLLGCGRRMKAEAMEPHLDRCEEERKQLGNRSKSRTPVNNGIPFGRNGNGSQLAGSAQPPRERLAELNYSLMNDLKMRSKLKELGIPSMGGRHLMIKRHTEWVNLWNASCDSSAPRSKRELLKDLDSWERTQGGRAPASSGLGSTVMRKDFDGAGWADRNREDFSRLIADARRTKANPTTPSKGPNKSDEPDANGRSPTDHADSSPTAPPPSSQVNFHAPYANNEVALSSIRQKVAAANAGEHIQPILNADFRPPSAGTHETIVRQSPEQTLSPLQHHAPHDGMQCDVPTHMAQASSAISPTGAVRVPMFAVPQRAVSDIDDGGGGGGGPEGASGAG